MSFIKYAPGTINKMVTAQSKKPSIEAMCVHMDKLIKSGELEENDIPRLIAAGVPKEVIDFYNNVFKTKEYQLYQLLK